VVLIILFLCQDKPSTSPVPSSTTPPALLSFYRPETIVEGKKYMQLGPVCSYRTPRFVKQTQNKIERSIPPTELTKLKHVRLANSSKIKTEMTKFFQVEVKQSRCPTRRSAGCIRSIMMSAVWLKGRGPIALPSPPRMLLVRTRPPANQAEGLSGRCALLSEAPLHSDE